MLLIPAFHANDTGSAVGRAVVSIPSRAMGGAGGTFSLEINVSFNPAAAPYPVLTSLALKVDLSDGLNGLYTGTTLELVNSYGRDTPTIYLSGRCKGPGGPRGLRYWLMIADNRQPNYPQVPEIVGFAIHDALGNQIAYGCGPGDGNIVVKST